VVGLPGGDDTRGGGRFLERLRSILAGSGRQVNLDTQGHDPRLAIVHDVELPIPLYYFEPVVGEVESAYLRLTSSERLAYNLHTDFNWEKSLPNLNPRRSEIAVGWSLAMLARGLVTGVVVQEQGAWIWILDPERDQRRELGRTLSSALYRLEEVHRNEDLQKTFQAGLERAARELEPATETERRRSRAEIIDDLIAQIGLRELDGEMSREDALDRPVLRALKNELLTGSSARPDGSTDGGTSAYGRLSVS
jgi:hypothetical protein